MSCKKHPADVSSSVGVCASCLRQRLLDIIAAQVQAQAQKQACRKSDTQQQPPPLSFPRSVSPYISRRKSDTTASDGGNHHYFHRTPQVGSTESLKVEINKSRKSNGGRFSSLFLGLFRSKSDKTGPDSGPISDPRVSIESCNASPSWFSSIIPGHRKKKNRTFSIDEIAIGDQRRACRNRDRGMSPARCSGEECRGELSGYSSESSQGWKQTPRRTPAAARRTKNVTGLAFCLSPLVRASPNWHWNQKGVPPEMVAAGDPRTPIKPQFSTTASFCKNRSRKLADFGRYSQNSNY